MNTTITFVFETTDNRKIKREVDLCSDQLRRADRRYRYDCMIATLRERVADAEFWQDSQEGRRVVVYMPGKFRATPLKAFMMLEMKKLIKHYLDMRCYSGD